MKKLRPYLIVSLCAIFWGLFFSPVLLRIDPEYQSVQSAMVFLCVVNLTVSLGIKKILKTDIKEGAQGILFAIFYTLATSLLILLIFQFHESKYR